MANRTATLTASAGAAAAQLPIQISGSTLSVFSTTGSNVPDDGTSPVTVTFVAKNAQGTALVGIPYTVAWTTNDTGVVALTPTSGVTDSNGRFAVTVSGVAGGVGSATVTATAAGSTASSAITVSVTAGTFAISSAKNNTTAVVTTNPTTVAMFTSDTLLLTVAAPAPATDVTFITSAGNWNGVAGQTSVSVPVATGCPVNAAGQVCATLQSPPAGTTTVQVLSTPNALTDSLSVSVTAKVPASITLQASPSLIGKSVGSTTGVSTLIATVTDATGAPVGDAPVSFSLSNTTGGGESVSPVLAYTTSIAGGGLALGQARTSFTSGSLSSTTDGVQVRATVLGTTVATEANLPVPLDATSSGNDAAIVIGGTAGSVAFGIATKIVELNTTTYQLPMSVLVADVNGNPAPNTTVTLSAWPAAWSTGTAAPCTVDADTATTGTFVNEDKNGNLILNAGEDGYREYLATGTTVAGGTVDGLLTPANSAAGSLPSSVITDANGLANFNLTYVKTSAIWTVARIRASAIVQGSEAVSQISFRLPAAKADADPPTVCYLASPYSF
ncbi:MAG TPA: hypothetical protein VK149_06445 [Sideroxyarcus sp.]|nr:hypothetical protein [Sideroxyarcus sp.]